MMMRKNVELQLQALQMIEYMCGLIPTVLQIEDGETLRNKKKLSPEDTERYVLISVLRQSKQEFDAMHKGTQEMEFVAREGQQQRERLENEILREEQLLQKALSRGKNDAATVTDGETPLSVAAIVISHMSTNTDAQSSSSSRDTRDAEMNTERPKSSKRSQSSSQTEVTRKDSTSSRVSRPGTANRQRTSITGEKSPTDKNGIDIETIESVIDQDSRPKSVKQPRPSLQMDEILTSSKETREDLGRSRAKSLRDAEQDIARPKSSKNPVSRKSSRPNTRSRRNSEETEPTDTNSTSRPSTKHTSRKENDGKTEDRPSTRRSSVDKNAPKRTDSIPNDRKLATRRDSQGETNKPPKHPGAVRVPRYPGDEPESQQRIETPGMEHGPRRKNLGDVHSQLVDRDRLNSSDVRARAEYLREQRDRLLQLKKEERIKQMNEATKTELERPKTAKAARGILDKKEEDEVRKEISRKLKTEILTIN